jgi:hypothetical protein
MLDTLLLDLLHVPVDLVTDNTCIWLRGNHGDECCLHTSNVSPMTRGNTIDNIHPIRTPNLAHPRRLSSTFGAECGFRCNCFAKLALGSCSSYPRQLHTATRCRGTVNTDNNCSPWVQYSYQSKLALNGSGGNRGDRSHLQQYSVPLFSRESRSSLPPLHRAHVIDHEALVVVVPTLKTKLDADQLGRLLQEHALSGMCGACLVRYVRMTAVNQKCSDGVSY